MPAASRARRRATLLTAMLRLPKAVIWTYSFMSRDGFCIYREMPMFQLNGSPTTAARQLVEFLTRDGILDENGNVVAAQMEAACRYVRPEPVVRPPTVREL